MQRLESSVVKLHCDKRFLKNAIPVKAFYHNHPWIFNLRISDLGVDRGPVKKCARKT